MEGLQGGLIKGEAVEYAERRGNGRVGQPALNVCQNARGNAHAAVRHGARRIVSGDANGDQHAAAHAGITANPDWTSAMTWAGVVKILKNSGAFLNAAVKGAPLLGATRSGAMRVGKR